MPDPTGQVTSDDFRAPEGKFRIMLEEMSDGQLSIVADFSRRDFAEIAMRAYETDTNIRKYVFTLCDEKGIIE